MTDYTNISALAKKIDAHNQAIAALSAPGFIVTVLISPATGDPVTVDLPVPAGRLTDILATRLANLKTQLAALLPGATLA